VTRPGDAIERVLIGSNAIAARVRELGAEISRDYQGRELFVVGILKGAALFLSDLVRCLEVPLSYDFMAVSSYGAHTRSSGVVRIMKDLDTAVEGRHVLLVEDIVDTGLTLDYLVRMLKNRHPATLAVCVLLDKPSRRQVPVQIDYCGFEVPDAFVVGYGLDYGEGYRQLPYIGVLKPSAYRVQEAGGEAKT
jgi:hypoxanthine phosphoribosyltransferase